MTLIIVMALAIVALVAIAAHYRGQSTAAATLVSKLRGDLTTFEQRLAPLFTEAETNVKAKVEAAFTVLRSEFHDLPQTIAALLTPAPAAAVTASAAGTPAVAANDPAAPAATSAAPPLAADAAASPAQPAAGGGGTDPAAAALTALDAQIAAAQDKRSKIAAAQQQLQALL